MRLIALSLLAALVACSPAAQPEAEPAEAEAVAAVVDVAIIDEPLPNARVTSPITVTGTAPAGWYFENQFPVRLVDAQGAELAFAPATPRVNWTENAEPKVFDAQIAFSVAAETHATLVLQEDMPREDEMPRETRVPVVLLPTP